MKSVSLIVGSLNLGLVVPHIIAETLNKQVVIDGMNAHSIFALSIGIIIVTMGIMNADR